MPDRRRLRGLSFIEALDDGSAEKELFINPVEGVTEDVHMDVFKVDLQNHFFSPKCYCLIFFRISIDFIELIDILDFYRFIRFL